MRYSTVYIIISLIFVGCKKPTIENGDKCMPLPETKSVVGWEYQYMHEDILPSFAVFNPNNADEILYNDMTSISNQKLVVYNTKTKEKRVLHTGKFMDNRNWAKNDWIVFDTHQDPNGGYVIYKVRPDGTQKQILASSGNVFYPVLSPDGNRFLYLHAPNTFVIKNIDGSLIKTCQVGVTPPYPLSWINDSIILFKRLEGVWKFNINTCAQDIVASSPYGESGFYGLGYLPPDKAIWGHRDHGIFSTSIYTGEQKIIKASCSSKRYYRMSYSPTIDRMLLYRETYYTPDSVTLQVNPKLVLMKTDGTCETEIEL